VQTLITLAVTCLILYLLFKYWEEIKFFIFSIIGLVGILAIFYFIYAVVSGILFS